MTMRETIEALPEDDKEVAMCLVRGVAAIASASLGKSGNTHADFVDNANLIVNYILDGT